MKPSTKIAIASLLSAAGAVLSALAAEYSGDIPETPEPETPAPKKPRGGKAVAGAAGPTEPATATETVAEPAAAAEGEGKSYEELRALIAPLVKDGQGEEVKKIIAKYSDSGLKGMEAKHQAAFEKDIAALSY
jgi:hypothetical protein